MSRQAANIMAYLTEHSATSPGALLAWKSAMINLLSRLTLQLASAEACHLAAAGSLRRGTRNIGKAAD